MYFDFQTSSRFTPYVGFGVGVGFTDMDYGGVWARNPDPTAIATGAGLIDLARAEPVAVAKHGRPVVVVMAVEEYERLKFFETGHVDSWVFRTVSGVLPR